MFKRLLKFILVLILTLSLTACVTTDNNNNNGNKIKNVEIDQSSIIQEVKIDEFDLSSIKLIITKEDGSTESIPVVSTMLSAEDLESLSTVGTKEIEITYQGFTLKLTINLIEEEEFQAKKINIFAINDTHGAFYTDNDNTGFEKVNTLLKLLEAQDGNYIKIANGDIFQGTYVSNIRRGLPLIDALNFMKFNAFVIGNHEFDWGIEEIAKFADNDPSNGEANFPFLACNIIENRTGKTLSWTKDYTIVEQYGYKIGIIGAIGEFLESSIAADKIQGYSFVDPVPIIKNLAADLRKNQKCNAVIVAIHEYSDDTNMRLSKLTGDSHIDAIISGHTHETINEYLTRDDGYHIPIIESSTKNRYVGTIALYLDENKKVTKAEATLYNPRIYDVETEMMTVIEKYRDDINAGERVITYTPEFLSRYRLGSEMTKAMKEKYKVDVTFINTGGVRNDINVGDIKVRHVFDVFPFDNTIVLTTMLGKDLKSLYNNHSSFLYFNDEFNLSKINDNQEYTVATIDYVFTGSYYKTQFANSKPNYTNVLMRDVFIEYLEN